MDFTRRVRNSFIAAFFAEKARSDTGFVSDTARFIVAGASLSKRRRLVIPSVVLTYLALLMFFSVVTHNAVYFTSLNLMNKVIDYGWSCLGLSSVYTLILYKKEIKALSKSLDDWWKYAYLEKETAQLKAESVNMVKYFNFFYFHIGIISICIYISLPLAKFFYKDPKERMEALIFQVWSPLPINTTWGFSIIYSWEALTIFCTYLIHNQLFVYMMSLAVVISHQVRLIGIAFTAIKQRVGMMMKDKMYLTEEGRQEHLIHLLDSEIRNGVIHFQQLHRSASEMSKIFYCITNVAYNGGMWVVCSVGVIAVMEMSFVMMMQACMMISLVTLTQYIFSFVSELLTEEIQKLRDTVYDTPWYEFPIKNRKTFHIFQTMLYADRFPTLKTYMGTKTNMENLSKVIYASYCYFSMIITMKTS